MFGCEHKQALMALAVVVEQLYGAAKDAGKGPDPLIDASLKYVRDHMYADNWTADENDRRERRAAASRSFEEFKALLMASLERQSGQ